MMTNATVSWKVMASGFSLWLLAIAALRGGLVRNELVDGDAEMLPDGGSQLCAELRLAQEVAGQVLGCLFNRARDRGAERYARAFGGEFFQEGPVFGHSENYTNWDIWRRLRQSC